MTICCQVCFDRTGIYSIDQTIYRRWQRYVLDGTLFRLGRLEFPLTVLDEDIEIGTVKEPSGQTVISVHIPRYLPLKEEDCEKSYACAGLPLTGSAGICLSDMLSVCVYKNVPMCSYPTHGDYCPILPVQFITRFVIGYSASGESVFLALCQQSVGDDAQDQCAGDGSQSHLAEGDGQTANAGDQNHSNYKQVLAGAQIDLLDHLQTGNCDEAVQSDADTAHDAVGDGSQEGNEGIEEGDQDAQNSSGGDGHHGSIAGDSHTTDRLTVGGVGAAAEESAGKGADAVTQQGTVQTGLGQQVRADDGGQVLVVSDVLSKDHERNRNVSDCNSSNKCAVDVLQTLGSFHEGEARQGNDTHFLEGSKVDDLQSYIVGGNTDHSENGSHNIANQNAQDEGDQLSHLLAVNREENNRKQRCQTADQCHIGAAGGNAVNHDLAQAQIANCIACQAEADDSNSGSDNHGGHQLVDPVNTGNLDYNSDDHIHQTRKSCADDQTGKTGRSGCRAAKGSKHRANECEGRAQEHRAAELSEQLVHQSADTCTEQGSGLAHAVTDNAGNCDGCCQNRQDLLECKNQNLAKFGFVFDAIDQIHCVCPP